MKAEIDVVYNGIEFSVLGEYEYDARGFERNVQVMHCDIDIDAVLDSFARDEIIKLADIKYTEWIEEQRGTRWPYDRE